MLTGTHRDGSSSHRTCMSLHLGPLHMLWLVSMGFAGLLTVAVGVYHSFACSWNSFPPTGLRHPASFMPSLIASSYAISANIPGRPVLF